VGSGVFVASLKPFFTRGSLALRWFAYAAAAAVFLWVCAQFYLPGKGFTFLIQFGSQNAARYLPELRATDYYEQPDSPGYDAQFYAEIAMHPQLGDPELRTAVDSLPYRARRILFCWTAYALALGDPVRALHIYAAQNIACWLLLGALLLRWFPPTCWSNFGRWAAVMFSFGLCFSVRGALVDGPSLLLIAAGMALAETNRPGWAAALFGVAGLGKETNILAGAAVAWPAGKSRRAWAVAAGRGLLVVLPLALWIACVWLWLGGGGQGSPENFAPPFFGFARKWLDALAGLWADGRRSSVPKWNVLILVGLTVQWLFIVLRPRWRDPWWRLAATYAVLMLFLGDAVWEGYPGAATRVLLPLTLAFNVLVPRGRAWWIVLLLGNAAIVASPDLLAPPGRESFTVEGPRALRVAEGTARTVEVVFDDSWYPAEKSRFQYWRWSRGDATIVLRNPQPFAVVADVAFELRSNDRRGVAVRAGDRMLWSAQLEPRVSQHTVLRGVRLAPGDTVWKFETDRPAEFPSDYDRRRIAFSLRDLELDLVRRAEE
jgi:hypothetical protein